MAAGVLGDDLTAADAVRNRSLLGCGDAGRRLLDALRRRGAHDRFLSADSLCAALAPVFADSTT